MNNVGLSAEYFVASELLRREFNIAVTLGNTKNIDLFAERNNKSFVIQVKGASSRKSGFRINPKKVNPKHWYILVNMNTKDLMISPECAVLKGSEVLKNFRREIEIIDNAVPMSIMKVSRFYNNWSRIR